MFCHITRNWRGRPPACCQVIVKLIAATTTRAGLKIRSRIDDNAYPLGVKVSDEQMKALNIRRVGFHGEWNYILIKLFWRETLLAQDRHHSADCISRSLLAVRSNSNAPMPSICSRSGVFAAVAMSRTRAS